MKRRYGVVALCALSAGALLCACSRPQRRSAETEDESLITVGFAQVGEESDWRRANSASIEDVFTVENGYRLIFDDAQNNPENQMRAIRNFIQQEVDYIILEPIIEEGWDTVLSEAKEAGIPVIAADRQLSVKDDDLITAWIGSDMLLEGQKVCAYLHSYAQAAGINEADLRIVNIQGTLGSAPQIDREQALIEACDNYGWKLLAQTRGEFTQAKGREAMIELLADYPDLNVVYCDNDNEAYGAIEALEEAGRTPGSAIENGEVIVVSFDAARKGLEYVQEGKILCDGDCNPLHGPRLLSIIESLQAKEDVAPVQYVDEGLYAGTDLVEQITVNEQCYPVEIVSEEMLSLRAY